MIVNGNFIIGQTFYEATKCLNAFETGELVKGVCAYIFEQKEITFSENVKPFFILLKPFLHLNNYSDLAIDQAIFNLLEETTDEV